MKKTILAFLSVLIGFWAFSQTKSEKILVAYFSNTGNTERVAKKAAEILKADVFQIIPEKPYTAEDLNWRNSKSRATLEGKNENARPAIAKTTDISGYDTIVVAYPIWWGKAPKIMSTFIESYDFSGKKIIPICTSHSSGFGKSDFQLRAIAKNAMWKNGKRFGAKFSESELRKFLQEINK